MKAKVEKLLKADFIYLVPLTEWVLNIVPITKKQGTIHVCVDYRDLNKACPKETILPCLSIRSSMIVPDVKSFHLWMASPVTIKWTFYQRISTKLHLFVHGVLFLSRIPRHFCLVV